MVFFRPIEIRPRRGYRLWLRFDDGVEGEVDLSDLAGQGVFAIWDEPGVFDSVRIGSSGEIAWGTDVDLCSDALYMRITGKRPEELLLIPPETS